MVIVKGKIKKYLAKVNKIGHFQLDDGPENNAKHILVKIESSGSLKSAKRNELSCVKTRLRPKKNVCRPGRQTFFLVLTFHKMS